MALVPISSIQDILEKLNYLMKNAAIQSEKIDRLAEECAAGHEQTKRLTRLVEQGPLDAQRSRLYLALSQLATYFEHHAGGHQHAALRELLGISKADADRLCRLESFRNFIAHPPCVHFITGSAAVGQHHTAGAAAGEEPFTFLGAKCSGSMSCRSSYAEYEEAIRMLDLSPAESADARQLLHVVFLINCRLQNIDAGAMAEAGIKAWKIESHVPK